MGVVGAPLMFGLARGSGACAGGLLTFTSVSGFHLAGRNCGKCHFFSGAFPSQLEVMVVGALSRASALNVGLGVGGTVGLPSCLDRVFLHITFVDFSFVDQVFFFRCFWFVLSYNAVHVRRVDSSTLVFSVVSFTLTPTPLVFSLYQCECYYTPTPKISF